MPYFLVGCPISAALPAARRRQGALAVADPAPSASATWPVVLAVSSSAASRRLRCAASRGGWGARERDAPGLNKRKFFEQSNGHQRQRVGGFSVRACGSLPEVRFLKIHLIYFISSMWAESSRTSSYGPVHGACDHRPLCSRCLFFRKKYTLCPYSTVGQHKINLH
jgi:hypothetical protein